MDDLQLDENKRFNSRWKYVQRAILGAMVLLVACALAGLLGNGWAGKRSVSLPEPEAVVQYNGLIRYNTPNSLRVEIAGPLPEQSVRLTFDKEVLDHVDILRVIPRPDSVRAVGDGAVAYTVLLGPARAGAVEFTFKPKATGLMEGRLQIEEASVALKQFIYP